MSQFNCLGVSLPSSEENWEENEPGRDVVSHTWGCVGKIHVG